LTTGYGSFLGLALGVLAGATVVTALVGGLVGLCLGLAAWTIGPEHISVTNRRGSRTLEGCQAEPTNLLFR